MRTDSWSGHLAAAELPNVYGVFLSDDLERAGKAAAIAGAGDAPFPPLARGRVLFVGDPVAIVVAESRALAEDAAELVEVDYEPAEVVVSIDDALRDSGPIVHEGQTSNLLGEVVMDSPGIDDIFESASHVSTETISQHRYVACPMETRGVVAELAAVSLQADGLDRVARRPCRS